MLTMKNYKLILLLAIGYFLLYHLYYARLFDYVVDKRVALGAQGEYLKGYIQRGKIFLWLINTLTVVMIFTRILLVTGCLLLGTFLSSKVKVAFRDLLKMVLLSEFVFLVRDTLVITFMLLSKNPDKPVVDASLSAGSVLGRLVREYPVMVLPASSISLYLLGYVLLLSFLLFKRKVSWGASLKFVCGYFGVGYLVWLLLSLSYNLYASN